MRYLKGGINFERFGFSGGRYIFGGYGNLGYIY